eukprot:TRINITY_DN7658_c0_g1_i1.p1 TRINITY_DN7658_c0_g1~~TRINITY_DN7658_c0_g1_i1.p1  ORF type:complete len:340 (-),score=31.27 TRINITY_DN7658_c0_g1_i1:59-1027(-)
MSFVNTNNIGTHYNHMQSEALEQPQVYYFGGNPYTDPAYTDVGYFHIEDSEYSTFVYHPIIPGNYPVLYFFGGFAGFVPSEMYTTVFKRIASLGVITIGFDILDPFPTYVKYFLQEHSFLKQNLNDRIANYAPNVLAIYTNNTAFSCHSGGCDIIAKIFDQDPDIGQVILLMDPVGYVIDHHMTTTTPTFITGSGIGDQFPLPCAPPGQSFKRFYNEWNCPKISYNATGYGHCAFADDVVYYVCKYTVCKEGPQSHEELDRYRSWASGVMVAMLGASLQGPASGCPGNPKQYVFDTSTMPINVSHFKVDFGCKDILRHTCLV